MSFRGLIIAVATVVAVVGVAGGIVLDVTLPQWDDRAPFTAAIAQAVLTMPLTVLLAAVVFERLLSAHLRSREATLRATLASFIEHDVNDFLDIVASQLFEPGARFPTLTHLEVVLRASSVPSDGSLWEDAVVARDTGAHAHPRAVIPMADLEVAADFYDDMTRRLGRLAEIDPDCLILHEECRLVASVNHLQIKRYADADGRGVTPLLVRHSWSVAVVSGAAVLRAVHGRDHEPTWKWPSDDGDVDIPRPERETAVTTTQWEGVQRSAVPVEGTGRDPDQVGDHR